MYEENQSLKIQQVKLNKEFFSSRRFQKEFKHKKTTQASETITKQSTFEILKTTAANQVQKAREQI